MKIIVLTVSIALMALTASHSANAAESEPMACGVKIGGFSLTYTAGSDSEKRQEQQEKKAGKALGLLGSDASGVAHYMRADAKTTTKGSDRRLPKTFTFAQFGCSF